MRVSGKPRDRKRRIRTRKVARKKRVNVRESVDREEENPEDRKRTHDGLEMRVRNSNRRRRDDSVVVSQDGNVMRPRTIPEEEEVAPHLLLPIPDGKRRNVRTEDVILVHHRCFQFQMERGDREEEDRTEDRILAHHLLCRTPDGHVKRRRMRLI